MNYKDELYIYISLIVESQKKADLWLCFYLCHLRIYNFIDTLYMYLSCRCLKEKQFFPCKYYVLSFHLFYSRLNLVKYFKTMSVFNMNEERDNGKSKAQVLEDRIPPPPFPPLPIVQ